MKPIGKKEDRPARGGARVWREAAPILVGRIRMPKDAEFAPPKPGSRLIFQPARGQQVTVGAYSKFVTENLTLWLRVERALERPKRFVVKVLGVSSDDDVDVAAYEAWDSGNGWVESKSSGVAAPTAAALLH